jgi:hypothetical protein
MSDITTPNNKRKVHRFGVLLYCLVIAPPRSSLCAARELVRGGTQLRSTKSKDARIKMTPPYSRILVEGFNVTISENAEFRQFRQVSHVWPLLVSEDAGRSTAAPTT